jgi:hypothetical protein
VPGAAPADTWVRAGGCDHGLVADQKFFTEPHYNGFPAVLVRLAAVQGDELAELITDARRCQAPPALVRDSGL